jgi:hypothetical protein
MINVAPPKVAMSQARGGAPLANVSKPIKPAHRRVATV